MTTLVAPSAAPVVPRNLDHPAVSPLDPLLVRVHVRVAPPADAGATVVVLSGHDAVRAARARALAAVGLRVVAVDTIAAARTAVTAGASGLVLDRRAPDGDALGLVDELYCTEGAPHVVVVATGDSERERVESLVAGADDVVPPGVPVTELVARVRRLVVPAGAVPCRPEPHRLAIGRVTIDQDRRSVRVDGTEVALSPTQYQILVSLAVERGHAVTVRSLVERCWDAHQERASCAVRTQVTRLRRALRGAVEIRCVRGEGYRLAEAEG